MICPFCGKENPDDLAVCGFCGGPLGEAADQPASNDNLLEPKVEIVRPTSEAIEQPEATGQPPELLPEYHPLPVQAPSKPTGGSYGGRIWWIVGCVVFICLLVGCIAAALGVYRLTQSSGLLKPFIEAATSPTDQMPVSQATSTLPPVADKTFMVTTAIPTQQNPATLFFDDFSNPDTGWDQVEEADYSTSYYAGSYRIVVNTDMSDSWANPAHQSFRDVTVEVDATKNGGPDDNDFGLICRYQDTNQFYYAVISSDGYYGITKVSSDTSALLGSDQLEFSDVINQGATSNKIRFDCIGDQLTLYANGQLLERQTDAAYTSGNVGLIAGSYSTPGTDILFDNFKVTAP